MNVDMRTDVANQKCTSFLFSSASQVVLAVVIKLSKFMVSVID